MLGISEDFGLGTTPTPKVEGKYYIDNDFKILTFTVSLVEIPLKHLPISETSDPSISVSPRE